MYIHLFGLLTVTVRLLVCVFTNVWSSRVYLQLKH